VYQIVFVSGENQIKYRLLNVINLMSQVGNSLLGVGQIGHQSWHAPSCVRRAGGKSKPLFALLSAKIKHNQPPKANLLRSPPKFLSAFSLSLSLCRISRPIFSHIIGSHHCSSCALFIALIQPECLTMTKVLHCQCHHPRPLSVIQIPPSSLALSLSFVTFPFRSLGWSPVN